MPNFPGSVYTPASKSAGQTITAAFFNDPDAEINAIEAGYINGTAPLNSSRSTVATLSVVGGSTFASRPVMPPPDAVRVSLNSTFTASSNLSTLTFLTQDYLTNTSLHSTTTNPDRLTPQSTGIYEFSAQALSSSNSTGYRQLFLQDSSGTSFARTVSYPGVGSTDVGTFFQVTGTKRFDVVGGYAVCVYQNVSASTLSLLATETWFAMHKL